MLPKLSDSINPALHASLRFPEDRSNIEQACVEQPSRLVILCLFFEARTLLLTKPKRPL